MSEIRHVTVAIVGGGLVGASAALALARQGVDVALFERRWCGAQASGVNYGGVRTHGRPEVQLPLAMRARRIWNRLPQLIGCDGEFVVSGHLRLARRDSDMEVLEAWAAMARGHGASSTLIWGEAFRRRYPWLGAAAIGGAQLVAPAVVIDLAQLGLLEHLRALAPGGRREGRRDQPRIGMAVALAQRAADRR
ncbi:FAD-binding oxidoreductase, partial [Burkholderia gladioli]|nr:FAD-binding oxidoreductase [Burkholderia gladioli]